MSAEEHQQLLEQEQYQCYWQTLNEDERLAVLNEIDPNWRGKFTSTDNAMYFHKPDFGIIWPILQKQDFTHAEKSGD